MANKKEEQMKILPNEYERNVVNRSTKLDRKGERSTAQNTTKKSVAQNTAKMSRTVANDKSRQNQNFLSSVAGRIGIVAREVRDIPTAMGTGLVASIDRNQGGKPGSEYLQKIVDNDTRADWNTRRQVKEAVKSITGKKGTRSDQIVGGKYINKTPKKKVTR
jgi:hypothetical protein